MKNGLRKILILVVTLFIIGTIVAVLRMAYTGYQVNQAAQGKDISISNMTKEQYLAQVKKNGGTQYEACVYNKLIDKYGVKETLKMDMRVAANENDVDSRLYSMANECM